MVFKMGTMDLRVIILSCLMCCASCILYSINIAKGPSEKDWKQYKLDYNKTYGSKEEEQNRHKIFKLNWNNIQKHNKRHARGQETYLQEVNMFADLTEKEFSDTYGLDKSVNITKYTQDMTANRTKSYQNDTEQFFDWRDAGAVTSAQNQGHCGSCWVFCAVGLLESYHFRKTKKLLDLSEQNIVDCNSKSSCSGGSPLLALQFVKKNGIHLESNYPYTGKQNDCANVTVSPININFENAHVVIGNDDELKEKILKQGPLAVSVYASSRWMFYKSGVWYHNECSSETNHCLLLIGYGSENGSDYWLFKNSWGIQWGQDGFIKIARNRHENYCGIDSGIHLQ